MQHLTSKDSCLDPDQYEVLAFHLNYNNKLDCRSFAALQVANPKRFKVGNRFQIQDTRSGRFKGVADIVEITPLRFGNLTEHMARMDSGYGKMECQRIFMDRYPNAFLDSENPLVYFMTLVKVDSFRGIVELANETPVISMRMRP